MGFNIGKRAVLTDLVLNLDASNRISYPGTGGSWYDISGNGNHFTLYNSPSWTGNALTFNQNGGNQYGGCNNNTCGNPGTNSYTWEYVVSLNSSNASNGTSALLAKRSTYVQIGGAGDGYRGWLDRTATSFFAQDNNPDGATNDFGGIVNMTATPTDNGIYHIVNVINRNGTQATGSQYKNGVLNGAIDTVDFTNAPPASGSLVPGDGNITNSSFMLMFLGPGGAYATGSLYLLRLYNKALTSDEVQTNYQAIRSKLGI
jgi:hypothetical protein